MNKCGGDTTAANRMIYSDVHHRSGVRLELMMMRM